MPYGIVYLPQSSFQKALVDYSLQLSGTDNAIMRLGKEALPHLTLAHAEGPYELVENWWHRVAAETLDTMTIKLTGLMISPIPEGDLYVPQGGIYIGIEAIRRPNLNAAHHEVLTAAHATGLSLIGATGQDFRPHLTLGVLRELPVNIMALPLNLLTWSLEFYLAFGLIGRYGTLKRVIAVCR